MKKYIKPTIISNTYVMFESVLADDSGTCFARIGRYTRGKECFHNHLGSGTACPWIDECALPFR